MSARAIRSEQKFLLCSLVPFVPILLPGKEGAVMENAKFVPVPLRNTKVVPPEIGSGEMKLFLLRIITFR